MHSFKHDPAKPDLLMVRHTAPDISYLGNYTYTSATANSIGVVLSIGGPIERPYVEAVSEVTGYESATDEPGKVKFHGKRVRHPLIGTPVKWRRGAFKRIVRADDWKVIADYLGLT